MKLQPPDGHDRRCLYQIRTARIEHYCGGYRHEHFRIKPGERYLVVTELPGGQSGTADGAGHPVSMSVCENCFPGWVTWALKELDQKKEQERGH